MLIQVVFIGIRFSESNSFSEPESNFVSLVRPGSQKITLFLYLGHNFVSLVRPWSQKIPLFLNLSHNFESLVRPGSQKITLFLYLGHNFVSLVRPWSQKITLFLYKGQKFVSLVQLGYMKKWTLLCWSTRVTKTQTIYQVRFKYGLKNSGFFVTS